jgi:DeoR family glycerol-3-phosphate regulon repressor
MTLPTLGPRERQILEQVLRIGFAGIDDLAQRFDVTPQTIRRCVNRLCEQGLLRRVHGGVDSPSHGNLPYPRRQILNLDAKRRIANAVAAFKSPMARAYRSVSAPHRPRLRWRCAPTPACA